MGNIGPYIIEINEKTIVLTLRSLIIKAKSNQLSSTELIMTKIPIIYISGLLLNNVTSGFPSTKYLNKSYSFTKTKSHFIRSLLFQIV